jgi:hypothetical protein
MTDSNVEEKDPFLAMLRSMQLEERADYLSRGGLRRSLYQQPAVNVSVSPAWRRQALINAVVAAQGGAQPSGPKFSNAPQ